uniref:RING-CH-type domain-containing protein n=1 Tax=Rhabditophanes sp. KR3021 TaxID=114890 RepID=A0AC35U7F4_9BILA
MSIPIFLEAFTCVKSPVIYVSEYRVNDRSNSQIRKPKYVEEDEEQLCRICFCGNELSKEFGKWMSPCKCIGSIKFVHEECFKNWLHFAPLKQQFQCNSCQFTYQKQWTLKPFKKWSVPTLQINWLQVVEIMIDIYSMLKLYRDTVKVLEGKKSLLRHLIYLIFWRTVIFPDNRISYYFGLGRKLLSAVFHENIMNNHEF